MNLKFEQPNINLEKQTKWNDTLSEVEKITDGLGKKVDSGIKETVVAFLVNGIKTNGSCEGHLDRGNHYPYIQIEHRLNSPEFKDEVTILSEQGKTKGYQSLQNIPESDTEFNSKVIELRNQAEKYKKGVETKIKQLLNTFYSSHKPTSNDYILTVWEGGSFFNIEPASGAGVGKDNWKKFEEKEKLMSPQQKEDFLKNSQAEMKAFTEFLKTKFFNK
jgi:hypothetical protein